MEGCEKYQEMLSSLLDGELSDSERAELERHIESCPECRAVHDAFLSVSSLLRDAQPAPAGFAGGVMEKISAPAPSRRFHARRWLAAAACFAVICAAGLWSGILDRSDGAQCYIMGSINEGSAELYNAESAGEAADSAMAGDTAPAVSAKTADSAPEEPSAETEAEAEEAEKPEPVPTASPQADTFGANDITQSETAVRPALNAVSFTLNGSQAENSVAGDSAIELAAYLAYSADADVPDGEPELYVEFDNGQSIALWLTEDGAVCGFDGTFYIPAGTADEIMGCLQPEGASE